jgi:hypothetical protein
MLTIQLNFSVTLKFFITKRKMAPFAQLSISWWMNKQNMVYPNNRILFTYEKKKWSADISYNTNENSKTW